MGGLGGCGGVFSLYSFLLFFLLSNKFDLSEFHMVFRWAVR